MPQPKRHSWESLWPPLLLAASEGAYRTEVVKQLAMGRAAAAIVLARSAWESYVNEFIERRELPGHLQSAGLKDKLDGIAKRLDEVPGSQDELWQDLLLVHDIRNAIVHYKAKERKREHESDSLPHRLSKRGILTEVVETANWESLVLHRSTAIWSCHSVANAIVTLESYPEARKRSLQSVKRLVAEAIRSLGA